MTYNARERTVECLLLKYETLKGKGVLLASQITGP